MKKIIFATICSLLILTGCSNMPKNEVQKDGGIENKTYTVENGIDELTNQIISTIEKGNKKSIAIVNFTNIDNSKTRFEKYISEELTTKMFIKGKFNIIERNLIEKVIEENQLNISGIIDESTAKTLGKILGVDAICAGSITDFGNSVKINSRIISTETGLIFSAASIKILKNDELENLMKPLEVNQIENKVATKNGNNKGKIENTKKDNIKNADINNDTKANINDDLLAYWTFEENLSDSSGNNNNLAFKGDNNSLLYERGIKGESYYNYCNESWFSIPSIKIIKDIENQITISLWIKSPNEPDNISEGVVISGAYPLNKAFLLLATKQYTGFIWRPIIDGKPSSYGEITIDSEYKSWTHVAVSYNGEYSKLYINGVLEKEVKAPGKLKRVDNSQIAVGSNYGTNKQQQIMYCQLDEIKIFKKALTSEEIKTVFNESQ